MQVGPGAERANRTGSKVPKSALIANTIALPFNTIARACDSPSCEYASRPTAKSVSPGTLHGSKSTSVAINTFTASIRFPRARTSGRS